MDPAQEENPKKIFEQQAWPAVDMLYRQAMKYTNNPFDAEDLVQDTFEKGFKAFSSFKPGTNLEAWLSTILKNTYFNQYHKAQRRPKKLDAFSGDYSDSKLYQAGKLNPGSAKSSEQAYMDGLISKDILDALRRLPEERRKIFIETAVDGKSYKQVAEENNIKIGTVMSRLNRARTQLKKDLAGYCASQIPAGGELE
ncbi:MAG: sigma-70 family RNA polymerase sigma factor [Aeriscardovia sp.]|nr:sigma-70 family RNA polymerase sigma factor [Aeriscardovia sp.]